jgi:hypothetical protein
MRRVVNCGARLLGRHLTSGTPHHVCGVESFGTLLAFKLYRVALVQRLIAIFLNCREMYEDVLSSGTLDKTVSFSSIEPLDHAIFLQANSLSDLLHAVGILELSRARLLA